MKQNIESRSRLTHIAWINFPQRHQDNLIGKGKYFQQVVWKLLDKYGKRELQHLYQMQKLAQHIKET